MWFLMLSKEPLDASYRLMRFVVRFVTIDTNRFRPFGRGTIWKCRLVRLMPERALRWQS